MIQKRKRLFEKKKKRWKKWKKLKIVATNTVRRNSMKRKCKSKWGSQRTLQNVKKHSGYRKASSMQIPRAPGRGCGGLLQPLSREDQLLSYDISVEDIIVQQVSEDIKSIKKPKLSIEIDPIAHFVGRHSGRGFDSDP